mmetsp:Transcript_130762/g.260877  ORF Transcript_130762/g.260877 Transcript_130762/m.260877 type:complete len:296 (-) Transcript_130762:263-1150(-)
MLLDVSCNETYVFAIAFNLQLKPARPLTAIGLYIVSVDVALRDAELRLLGKFWVVPIIPTRHLHYPEQLFFVPVHAVVLHWVADRFQQFFPCPVAQDRNLLFFLHVSISCKLNQMLTCFLTSEVVSYPRDRVVGKKKTHNGRSTLPIRMLEKLLCEHIGLPESDHHEVCGLLCLLQHSHFGRRTPQRVPSNDQHTSHMFLDHLERYEIGECVETAMDSFSGATEVCLFGRRIEFPVLRGIGSTNDQEGHHIVYSFAHLQLNNKKASLHAAGNGDAGRAEPRVLFLQGAELVLELG